MTDWTGNIIWDAPAGQALQRLFTKLPPGREVHVTLFGSSPLQLRIDPGFISGDIDLFADDDRQEIDAAITAADLADKANPLYIQLCAEGNFRTSPRWKDRAFRTRIGQVHLVLPHPIDILIAKLHRLADKDMRAFHLVIDRTGHPTEAEMKEELQFAVDLYRPNFDEEMIGDITTNTRVLWNELWGRDINVRQEIIAPALARRREGYALDVPQADYKAELRRLAES